ncbi:MAG: hypothetical protein P4L84_25240 [Isosphaeraceae bacterium]|nr:hypothetical protein [Isosphaeraceae bacterium]
MTLRETVIALLLVYPVLYASVLLHELGHVVTGHMAGFTVTSFGVGTARPLWVFRVAGLRVYFAVVRPFVGLTWAFMPQLFPSKGRLVAFAAGGILANASAVAVALLCWGLLPWGGAIWIATAAINGFLAVFSLVPLKPQTGKAPVRTDGTLILQALRSESFAAPPPLTIQTERAFRGLWSAIGDDLMLQIHQVSAAEAWAALGEYDRAKALLAEADGSQGSTPSTVRALGHLVRGEVATGLGRFSDAGRALDDAEASFRDDAHALGLLTVALCRAQLRLQCGDAAGAVVDLDSLLPRIKATGRAELSTAALLPRVGAAVILSDREALSQCMTQYERARRSQHSAVRDLYVYQTGARFYTACGERTDAEPYFRRAIAAAAELAAAWLDPGERKHFIERSNPLIEEARQCLGGSADLNQLLVALDPGPEEARRERDQRLRGVGLRLLLMNGVGIAAVAALARVVEPIPCRLCIGFAVVLGLCTAIAGLYLVLDRTVGRWVPALRWTGGMIVLLLACFPWALVIGLVAIFLTFRPPSS